VPVAFGIKGAPRETLPCDGLYGGRDHLCTDLCGPTPQKFGRANWPDFRGLFEYLKNWSRYQKSETDMINNDPCWV